MRFKALKKLVASALAGVMLAGGAAPLSAAENADGGGIALQEASDLTTLTYDEYRQKYDSADYGGVRATDEVTIRAADYVKSETTAKVTALDEYEGETDVIRVEDFNIKEDDTGIIKWNFNVPSTGYYCISFTYASVFTNKQNEDDEDKDRKTDIERILYINDEVPFSQARYLSIKKTWEYTLPEGAQANAHGFAEDTSGNELRPNTIAVHKWDTFVVEDSDGYYKTPFEFYLKEGANSISLEGVREAIALKEIRIYGYEDLPTYADVQASYAAKGYKEATGEAVKIEAEKPSLVSNYTIYPSTDRSSAITDPQHATLTYRNMIGDNWSTCGQWIEYEFNIQSAGLYTIVTRYRQADLRGVFTNRRIYIDGEIPFQEANNARFSYSSSWQVEALTDGTNTFEFYLEPGVHTLRFEVSLGNMSDIISSVNNIMTRVNDDYLEILKITGIEPDESRDYGFLRIMPETIDDLYQQSQSLYDIINAIVGMNGIKTDYTSTLESLAQLLDTMGTDEGAIAANLETLKTQISSLGTWLTEMSTQILKLDYILVQPKSASLPVAEANFWQSLWHEIKMFFGSFFTDYNSMAGKSGGEEKSLDVWTSSGRDQAQITKALIDDGFTEANVTLKLTAAGTLLPSILAGVGPDVSIDATNPIDMAIRGAIFRLNDFDTFDEVIGRFATAAMTPISLYGETYAIPVGQVFPVLFYRTDILEDLNLSVPRTWDEMLSMVPVLQFNNMNVGVGGLSDLTTLLFQNGGEYWAYDGMAINFDNYLTLDSFETMCNMFTQYSLPVAYSLENRFKTGEIPIAIADYSTYNTITIFAPEIAGLWEFTTLPGTLREDGTVDNTATTYVNGIIMPRGCSDTELSWDFMDWYSGADFQVNYSDEMVALLGPAAKQPVANLEALQDLPWSAKEYRVLESTLLSTKSVEFYPGSYYAPRYVGFAFAAAYNEFADPSESLQYYVPEINVEITRKRKEFDLMLMEDWEGLQLKYGYSSYDEWRAVQQYAGVKNHSEWEAYMSANGITSHKQYMEQHNLTVENYLEWKEATNNAVYTYEQLTYKEWEDIRQRMGYTSIYEWRAIYSYEGFRTHAQFEQFLTAHGISDFRAWMEHESISAADYKTWKLTMGRLADKGARVTYQLWRALFEYMGFTEYSELEDYMEKNEITDYSAWADSLGITQDNYKEYMNSDTEENLKDWLAARAEAENA